MSVQTFDRDTGSIDVSGGDGSGGKRVVVEGEGRRGRGGEEGEGGGGRGEGGVCGSEVRRGVQEVVGTARRDRGGGRAGGRDE